MADTLPIIDQHGSEYPYVLRWTVHWSETRYSHLDIPLSVFPADENGRPSLDAITTYANQKLASASLPIDISCIDYFHNSLDGYTDENDNYITLSNTSITGFCNGVSDVNDLLGTSIVAPE